MADIKFPFSIGRPSEDVPAVKASAIDVDKQIGDIEATDLQSILEQLSIGSGKITVDSELDVDSTNPVQNKTLANILIFS